MRSGRTERRDVPHEDGAWMEFVTLSGRQVDEAEEIQTRRGLKMVEGIDLSSLQAAADAQKKEEREAYDKSTLIKYGVVGCSECEPCTDEAKDTLDAQTRNWAVSVIKEMNIRPLASGKSSDDSSSTGNSHQNSASLTASSLPE